MLNVSAKCFQTDELRHQYIKIYSSPVENFGYRSCDSDDDHKTEYQTNYQQEELHPDLKERLCLDLSSLNKLIPSSENHSEDEAGDSSSSAPPLPPPCRLQQPGPNVPPPLIPRGPKNLPPPPSLQYLRTLKHDQVFSPPPSPPKKKTQISNFPRSKFGLKSLKTRFCTNI